MERAAKYIFRDFGLANDLLGPVGLTVLKIAEECSNGISEELRLGVLCKDLENILSKIARAIEILEWAREKHRLHYHSCDHGHTVIHQHPRPLSRGSFERRNPAILRHTQHRDTPIHNWSARERHSRHDKSRERSNRRDARRNHHQRPDFQPRRTSIRPEPRPPTPPPYNRPTMGHPRFQSPSDEWQSPASESLDNNQSTILSQSTSTLESGHVPGSESSTLDQYASPQPEPRRNRIPINSSRGRSRQGHTNPLLSEIYNIDLPHPPKTCFVAYNLSPSGDLRQPWREARLRLDERKDQRDLEAEVTSKLSHKKRNESSLERTDRRNKVSDDIGSLHGYQKSQVKRLKEAFNEVEMSRVTGSQSTPEDKWKVVMIEMLLHRHNESVSRHPKAMRVILKRERNFIVSVVNR